MLLSGAVAAASYNSLAPVEFPIRKPTRLSIRPAPANDIPLILELIRELAEYEREPQAAVATKEDLLRDGFTPNAAPKFRVVIAEWEGKSAGFALFFYNYSTWQGRPGL